MGFFSPGTPTPYPDINRLLKTLLKNVQEILGADFVGMYLDGSLAWGDFDQDSDIDFVVVIDVEVPEARFMALQVMHDRLAKIDSDWVIQLEGFYVSRQAVRRYDPYAGLVPNIERGSGERLKLVKLDPGWQIHCSILVERGITLAGPAPQTLIDAVTPAQLKQAVRFILYEWIAKFIEQPDPLKSRGYQSYTVLSLCRVLYTLAYGEIASKKTAANWAQSNLNERWMELIERAWQGRHHPGLSTTPEEMEKTIDFIRYALETSRDSD